MLRGLLADGGLAEHAGSSEPNLGDGVVAALEVAAKRWGTGRVGAIYTVSGGIQGRGPWSNRSARGPSYVLSGCSGDGHALHSGLALLRSDLVDAVLLASVGTLVPSSLLVERHGLSDVRVRAELLPRADATFRPGTDFPSDAADMLAAVAVAASCLEGGFHPDGADAEPDRINIMGRSDTGRTDGFSVELAT